MYLPMIAAGAAGGVVVAYIIFALCGWFRVRAPLPLAVIGWLIALITGRLIIWPFLPPNPWSFFAFLPTLLLLILALIGVTHKRRFALPWYQAFGILVAEQAFGILAAEAGGYAIIGTTPIAYRNEATDFAFGFLRALFGVLLLLEIFEPLFRIPTPPRQ